jgi:TonB family protein
MRRISIGFSTAVLLCAGGLAPAQEKSSASQESYPFLKACSHKNPPPCADTPPAPYYTPDPEYSKGAKKARISGVVVLTLVVGTNGLIHDVSVVRSLGYGLDEEAIKVLKTWKFRPGKSSGKPAPVKIAVEMPFP